MESAVTMPPETAVSADKLPLYLGPRTHPGGYGLTAITRMSGQREASSWWVHHPDGPFLVNLAVYTPRGRCYSKGYRWEGLCVVSVHRITSVGVTLLHAIDLIFGELKSSRGAKGDIQPHDLVSKRLFGRRLNYEVSDFVNDSRFAAEFPVASLRDTTTREAVQAAYVKLGVRANSATVPVYSVQETVAAGQSPFY